MRNSKEILVFADWYGMNEPRLVGTLYSTFSRGKEIFSFEYDKNWLQSSFVQEIDPDLGLYSGVQYLRDEKKNFGVFMDSTPDRWGRLLMDRRESILARAENRQRINYNESDYLLGVFDKLRMGALRFKETVAGNFMNDSLNFTAPPWTSLRELECACYQLENELIVNPVQQLTNINTDLEELFRRIVFSVSVSNTDDHLRNHGFLLTNQGWTLSPAYDINPNPKGAGLKLNISTHDNSLDFELAIEVAPSFRLTKIKAEEIVQKTVSVVSNWKQIAVKYGVSREEQDRMSTAFKILNKKA